MSLFARIKEVWSGMFSKRELQEALGVDVAVSTQMQAAVDRWQAMFQNRAHWLAENVKSLNLPAAIAGEFARLAMVEFQSQVTGSRRAKYLQEQYQAALRQLRAQLEFAAANGGMVFKPYVDGDQLAVDFVPAGRFFPTGFNSRGEITGAVFLECIRKGEVRYTRAESHQMTEQGYRIYNKAYASRSDSILGRPVPLKEIDEWADLTPELILKRENGTAPERPLFAYCKMPFANQVDTNSPLGVSVYSRAEGLIEQADRQYSRILWEFEGSELAIDADETCLRAGKEGGKLPEREDRLFRRGVSFDNGDKDFYQIFSPAIRDSSLFHGLNQLLRRIEFNCCLSYGTLSDPQEVSKTAEEIKTSKQRSYSAVCDMQKGLQAALEQLVRAMDFYADFYALAPDGGYEVSFTWGDGVLEDTNAEFVRRKALADAKMLRPELLLSWYFGVSEEEAKTYLPDAMPHLFED